MIEHITGWRTSDGQMFAKEDDAFKHEAEKEIDAFIACHSDRFSEDYTRDEIKEWMKLYAEQINMWCLQAQYGKIPEDTSAKDE